jgi:mono/diheme cytochrome c family protein
MTPANRGSTPCGLLLALAFAGLSLLTTLAKAADGDEMTGEPRLDPWCCTPERAQAWDPAQSSPALTGRAERHREFLQAGVPLEYRSRKSPYPAAAAVIRDGGELYLADCAECHGAAGMGNGDAGRDLRPSPALLGHMIDRPEAIDEYLLWSIFEGGQRFGTDMPAFKDRYSEHQVWQVVAYMRAGFPPVDGSTSD